MENCLLDIAKNEVPSLVNLVRNEAQYLCCYNSYVENFNQKKAALAAKQHDVKRKFQKGKGVFSFKYEARQWEHEADDIIQIETKIKKKFFFGWCPNCWWQYRRGKELAEKTQHIDELLRRCNSNVVAGRANIPDIKFLSSQDFIHFESRNSKFQELLKLLQDDNCSMVGLQGMGGAGKTSMAKEVGHKLKESKLIDKFIFLVISNSPDFKKIRGELAKGLDLNLEEVKEEEHSNTIWSRITNMDGKFLIILDDVWENFDLTGKLGIPSEHQYKGYSLLITTRNLRVFQEMGCRKIELQKLTDEEALNLFETHARYNNSSRGLKGMPQKIVKHCGGVPVAIVAMARGLRNQPTSAWKDALKTLEDRGVDPNLEEAYKCLKLSYDNLKNEKAKQLLLISSLFPEDSEIPLRLLTKIGIGLGFCNGNDPYHLTRSEVHGAIMELIYSSLLLNGEEECVKLHDLVREVALWIGDKDIQSVTYLKMPIKVNLKYLFWKNRDFPDGFDGSKLEVLLIFLEASEDLKVPNAFFKKMEILNVLTLAYYEFGRVPALSLTKSFQALKDIQTLILGSLELGDISVLGNLSSLKTLWFIDCSITELPSDFLKLNMLRSLDVEDCTIEKNNPFTVIERCSQLQELTFVGNKCDYKQDDEINENGPPLTLHRYCISSMDSSDFCKEYGSMSRCLQIDGLSHSFSDATFKQLVARAEFLLLDGQNEQTIWKNLIPDIVPMEKAGVMNDLIVLELSSFPDMECLIDTKDQDSSVTAFCNLAELHLSEMGLEDLCQGLPLSGFLEQLETMELMECHKLKSILYNGKYNLCHLRSMELRGCPMLTSVFQPSTAQSLKQLEELTIIRCSALEYIVVGEDGESDQKSYYDSLFPKLKIFQIEECNKLRVILPFLSAGGLGSLEKISVCESEQLQYIFDKLQEGKDAMLPSLKELQLSGVPSLIGIFGESLSGQKPSLLPLSRHNFDSINQSLAARAFSWVQACFSINKSKFANEENNSVVSIDKSSDHTDLPGLLASTQWIHTAPTLIRQLVLHVRHIKKMKLKYLSLNLVSALFTLSMASMISLEELTITNSDGLKHLVTSNEDVYKDQTNCCSIFPELQKLKIKECKEMEFIFLSTVSVEIKKLKSLTIKNIPKLTYLVGTYEHQHCISKQNPNDELHFDLPDLEALFLEGVPQFISIGPMNYKIVLPSLLNSNISKDELVGKVTRNEGIMVDPQQSTMGTHNLITKDELVDKEVKKETIMMEPKSQEEMKGHDIQSHMEEEEEKEDDDIQVSDKCPETVIGNGISIPQPTTLYKGVSDKNTKQTNVIQDESKENSSNLRQMEQEPSSCSNRGQTVHHDVTKYSDISQALNVGGVQEIIKMMKLDGSETSLLAKALKTRPKLCLSTNDRSTQMMCISYTVLIDILNILTSKTPFTITEADKRLLEDKLKDASLLGFDKDWLQSIKTKVYNCDVSEVNGTQEILKGLESDLKTTEAMLEATRNQEVEAAQVVESAQKKLDVALQEHAKVMANHTQLLKECQDILTRQNQCQDMIAAKNKHFGF